MSNTTALDLDRLQRFNNRSGLMNPEANGLYYRVEDVQALARRSLPVDASGIKTWQERAQIMFGDEWESVGSLEVYKDAEIADLRAALAAKGQQEPVAKCATCDGTGIIDDGEIDCYPNGEPYMCGPVKCVTDCPICKPAAIAQAIESTPVAAPVAQQSEAVTCTCPSGDGSLRWPCPKHPPEAAQPVEAGAPTAATDKLHNAIMNLPCKKPDLLGDTVELAYKKGHRDARHAAADLANEYDSGRESAAPVAQQDANGWSQEPPTEQGEYWHWNGDEDTAPYIYHILWSGTAKKCFVSIGQYGITEASFCDEFGGWWKKITQPSVPLDAAMQKGAGNG